MDADDKTRPRDSSWVIAVHASENGHSPSGAGFVIDSRRILTCAHVARDALVQGDAKGIWVAFPKAKEQGRQLRLKVTHAVFADEPVPGYDLAILYLPEPVPASVSIAPLRYLTADSLLSRRWQAFGFPDGDPKGDVARGHVEATLADGGILLEHEGEFLVKNGFSGAGVWSPDYQAVVAVLCEVENARGDGRAITLREADACLPGERMRVGGGRRPLTGSDAVAVSAWNWSLAGDYQAREHWLQKARGVADEVESGHRFRGRAAALSAIRDWLDSAETDPRMLVVTGAPGAGKSAVLGRIVTTADADTARQLPASDTAVRATAGSVGCAVHAKGKTALDVATEIARAASAKPPEKAEGLAHALSDVLSEQPGRRFNVIVDAVDEAASPSDARDILGKVLVPMAAHCADGGVRVVAGARYADSDGPLLLPHCDMARLLDLDDPAFYAHEDLVAYALATLQRAGDERQGGRGKPHPYADGSIAGPVAARIAELSGRNFLVAGLTAYTRGMYDETPVSPAELSFSSDVEGAMREYLKRVPDADGINAGKLLTALAFAEASGFPASLWGLAARTLGFGDVPERELKRFARSRAASVLIESSDEDRRNPVFRLFHQALSDVLLTGGRPAFTRRAEEEEPLTRAFLEFGREKGWQNAPTYLLRLLPAHAARSGLADDLLADDGYLLHADLRQVLRLTGQAGSPAARDRARLIGLTPEAVTAGPAERAALFSVTEALEGLGSTFRNDPQPLPYRAQWAAAKSRYANLTLRVPRGRVEAVCGVESGSRTLLATGGRGGTVRLWDPADGTQIRAMGTGQGGIHAMCAVETAGRTLLAIGGYDGTVELWDPADGTQIRAIDTSQDWVAAMCAAKTDSQTLLATVGHGGTVVLWDPADGTQIRDMGTGRGGINAVCAVETGGRTLLAAGDSDGTVVLWGPVDGTQVRDMGTGRGGINAVCAVETGGRTLLATVSVDGTAGLWDPADGTQIIALNVGQDGVKAVCEAKAGSRALLAAAGDDEIVQLWDLRAASPGRGTLARLDAVRAVCAVEVGSRTLLATAGHGGTVQLWDLADGTQVRDMGTGRGGINAVCAVETGGRTLLATAGHGGTVQLWDPADGTQIRAMNTSQDYGIAVCAVETGGRTLLAAADHTAVQLWDPADGVRLFVLETNQNWVAAVCAVETGDQTLLATVGGDDRTVRLWDPADGTQVRAMGTGRGWINAVCAAKLGGRTLLATVGGDGTMRLWDPADGTQIRATDTGQSRVHDVCAVETGGQTLLATVGGDDRTVRLWNPADGTCVVTVPIRHTALSAAPLAGSLAVGLDAGVLVIGFDVDFIC